MNQRDFDLVLFGATGFTGGLTAEYLAASLPSGARWAIAGRNSVKLDAVKERLLPLLKNAGAPDTVIVDSSSKDDMDQLASRSKVVVTTVGPYISYGEPLVAACAAAGTAYLDLTGEPEFVDAMYNRHQDAAVASGAKLVHCCGFDSIPHDAGTYFNVLQMNNPTAPVSVQGYVQAKLDPSGGTLHSAVGVMSRFRQGLKEAKTRGNKERKEPTLRPAKVRFKAPHRVGLLKNGWAVPMPTIDPTIVTRSARTVDGYGDSFTFGLHWVTPTAFQSAALGVGSGFLAIGSQFGPLRRKILTFRNPGEGPSKEARDGFWFVETFVGESDNKRVVTRVSGKDPAYDETAKMLGESAMCLAFDQVPDRSGQLTPVAAMESKLVERLHNAGIKFEVLESDF